MKVPPKPIDAPCTVLLVEDSLDDAYFFQRALKKAEIPCEFKHVRDGREAVELLRTNLATGTETSDIVFLDLKMPVMNGFEVLEWIRRNRDPALPPVVVLSGSDQQDDQERARKLGAVDYLVKPVTSGEISDRLRRFAECAGTPA